MAAYRRQVDKWTNAAVHDGVDSFDELIVFLPGVYPPVVAESLTRLLNAGVLTRPQVRRVTRRLDKSQVRMSKPPEQVLPAPIPSITIGGTPSQRSRFCWSKCST